MNFRRYLFYLVYFTFPIMSLVDYFGVITFNSALSDIFILPLMIVLILDLRHNMFKSVFPYWGYFLALILLSAVSNIIADINGTGTEVVFTIVSESIKILISASYFFVAYNSINDKNDIPKILNVWLAGTWVVLLVGFFIQINFYLGNIINFNSIVTPTRGRFLGTITDSNIAATYLGLSFIIAYILYSFYINSFKRFYYVFTMIFCIVGVTLTFSRGGLISFIISILLLIIIERKIIFRKMFLLFCLIIIVMLLVLNLDMKFFDGKMISNFMNRLDEIENKEGQYVIRTSLAKVSFEMWKDHPIFGVGKGNFINNSEQYFSELANRGEEVAGYGFIPHNTILAYLAETGIVGVFVFMTLPFILIVKLFYKKNWINIIFICMFVQIAVHSLSINIENFRGLWILAGIAIAYNVRIQHIERVEFESSETRRRKEFVFLVILILIAFGLYLDTGRKVPSTGSINKTIIKEITISDLDKRYVLHYYISNTARQTETPFSITLSSIDENGNIVEKKEYNYYSTIGFVNESLTLPDNTKRVQVVLEPPPNNDGKILVKDMYLKNVVNSKTYTLLSKSLLLPKILENSLSELNMLSIDSMESELFGIDSKYSKVETSIIEIKRLGLVTNNISYSVKYDAMPNDSSEEVIIKTYIVEKNINNLPGNQGNGIITLVTKRDYDEDGTYLVSGDFMKESYDENYSVYVRLEYGNDIRVSKIDFPIQTNNTQIVNKLINSSKYTSIMKEPVIRASNGAIESQAVLLNRGRYSIKLVCKGSQVDGVYPLIRVDDNKNNELIGEGYITGDYAEYNSKPVLIYSDVELKSFLVYFLNDKYLKKGDTVMDRNLYIKDILIKRID